MAGTHAEVVLKKLSKPELVRLLNTEANMCAHIASLTTEIWEISNLLEKLETDVTVTKNVNSRLADQFVETARKCWVNAHYSR